MQYFDVSKLKSVNKKIKFVPSFKMRKKSQFVLKFLKFVKCEFSNYGKILQHNSKPFLFQ